MTKFIEVSGKTEDEAIAAGLAQLNLTRDDVSLEILERAKSGFLGIGSAPAKIRLSYEVPDEVPAPAEEKPAQPEKPARSEKPRRERGPKPEKKPQPEKFAKAESAEKPAKVEKAPKTEKVVPEGTQREQAERYLRGLLDLMGVEAELLTTERENGGLNIELSGPGMGAVIGRRGETLDAIQHLVNYSVNRGSDKRMHISVDAENYRSKREDSLVHLAEKMAAKVIKYKHSMALEPMNSYERHVIHTALQNYEGVSTASIGMEPNRRVVISYERGSDSSTGSKPQSREWA